MSPRSGALVPVTEEWAGDGGREKVGGDGKGLPRGTLEDQKSFAELGEQLGLAR